MKGSAFGWVPAGLSMSLAMAGPPAPFPTASGAPMAPEVLDAFLAREMARLGMPGLSIAVISDGRISYHRTLGTTRAGAGVPVTKETLFDAGSLTKPVFTYLALRMVDQGLLDLDRPLYTYLPHPDLPLDDQSRLITARMVLSHRTGLPNWRFGKPLRLQFTPGTAFLYSGEGFEYLALVMAHLKRLSKDGLSGLFEREVASPLGMVRSHTVWSEGLARNRASGHFEGKVDVGWGITEAKPGFMASYSLNTEAMDYARFLLALMDGKGLRPGTLAEMLRPQATDGESRPPRTWGLGLEVRMGPGGARYLHSGSNRNFTSQFVLIPSRKFGYVFFTNCEHAMEANKAIEAFLEVGP